MKKIILAILIIFLALSVSNIAVSPVRAQDYPNPPLNPYESWQPPYEGGFIEPVVSVEIYGQTWSGLNIPSPSAVPPGIPSSIVNVHLVDSRGRSLTNLHRNQACYLILSVNGPGYLYLWEYYPSGTVPYGHWLCYRWYCKQAGIWKLGPFVAESFDPAGQHTWKMWFLSGFSWSSRTLRFDLSRKYYPPDIPEPVHSPVINSFDVNKSTIESGEAAVLTWTTTNARSVTISPDIGAVAGSGSTSVTPASTTTYALVAEGKSGDSVSSTTTITVMPRTPPEINIGQATMKRGQSTSLSWSAPGAVKVSITGVGEVSASGTTQVSPDKTTTYTLSATYIDGSMQSASAKVTVKQLPYWLWGIIAFLVIVAVGVAVLLIIRRRRRAHRAQAAGTQAGYTAQSESTNSTDTAPVTTPLVNVIPAKLTMPNGEEILLAGNARSLGRRDFEEFMPQDQACYLSRQHINIWYENEQYYIEDRSSTNGTKINGVDIRGAGSHALVDGDVIELASKLSITFKVNKQKEGE